MELVIVLGISVSVVINALILSRLPKLQSPPEVINLSPPVTGLIECDCKVNLAEEVKELRSLVEANTPKAPPKPDESHLAWRNKKEEPTFAPPSPHGPPPIPGPLERPYGFTR